ncbi:MAG TPA: hypothetical protein VK517_17800, partial [Cyclobacteriaceae bacterium]|nr:hypothetical protein [Cyclobacteriaceae bacterium]
TSFNGESLSQVYNLWSNLTPGSSFGFSYNSNGSVNFVSDGFATASAAGYSGDVSIELNGSTFVGDVSSQGDYFGSGNKITGDYAFVKTGNGWTGEVTGLGVAARNSKTNQILNAEFGPLCITIKPIGPNTQQGASDAFVQSWNAMTDRLENWLDAQGDRPVTNLQLQNQAMSLFNTELNMNALYSSTSLGPCSGNVPVTQATYSWWDSLFK